MRTPLAVAGLTGIRERKPLEVVLTGVCPKGHAKTRVTTRQEARKQRLALIAGTILVVMEN